MKLGFLSTLVFSLFASQNIYAIQNGNAQLIVPKTILLQTTAQNQPICTATVVKRSRCLVTASHCNALVGQRYYQGATPLTNPTTSKMQEVVAVVNKSNPAQKDIFQDISVVWISNFTGGAQARMQEPGDYESVEYAEPTELQSVPYNRANQQQSQGGPKVLKILGYGFNNTVNNVNVGEGTQRSGNTMWLSFSKGSLQNPAVAGSVLTAQKGNAPFDFNGCEGDSGGPAFRSFGGVLKTVGVFSEAGYQGQAMHCANAITGYYSGFEKGNPGNYEWLEESIQKTCTRNIGFMGTNGKVVGSVTREIYYPNETPYNGLVNCSNTNSNMGDCTEAITENMTGTVTATPDTNYTFDKWDSLHSITPDGHEEIYQCPCIGQGATCNFSYLEVGKYTPTISDDNAYCIAAFKPASGPGCGTTTGGGATPICETGF